MIILCIVSKLLSFRDDCWKCILGYDMCFKVNKIFVYYMLCINYINHLHDYAKELVSITDNEH